jgi:hypothetical protein
MSTASTTRCVSNTVMEEAIAQDKLAIPSPAGRQQQEPRDPRQVVAWRAMSPARRLELAFQAYQFALDIVRLTEKKAHPDLSPEELAWRVTRRMQGNPRLGR